MRLIMNIIDESKKTNIVSYPRFQGRSNNEENERYSYIEEIEFLSQHPDLLDVLKHQLYQIKSLFKAEIDELKKKKKDETRCVITSMKRTSPNVVIVVTQGPDHEDLLRTMEKFPRYREKIVRGHRALMRALNIKVD
jgi:hypothetical protein